MIPEEIKAKKLISRVKEDRWFGFSYNLNLYRGCQHGCIYCDSRSSCYQLGNLSDIKIKQNALELLGKELKSIKQKGTIGFGSMNDPYMPIEQSLNTTRKALEICAKYNFPIHLITKSNLVVRDIDILQKISATYAAISITITTTDNALAKKIEPNAPTPSDRFKALQTLSEAGIYCGITLMPVLPFINDTVENIEAIFEQASQSGVKYIIGQMGVTLRDTQRDYFYKKLDENFPGLKEKYITTYGEKYNCMSPEFLKLQNAFVRNARKYNIATHMKFYSPPKQLTLF